MLLTIVQGTLLAVEVFIELARVAFVPRRSIQEALKGITPELSGVELSVFEQDFTRRLARIVWRVSKVVPFRSRCIHRSVAAYRILQRRNIPCRLVIAPMDGQGKKFSAHAWVEAGDTLTVGAPVAGGRSFQRVAESVRGA
jgi:hypothetical protein